MNWTLVLDTVRIFGTPFKLMDIACYTSQLILLKGPYREYADAGKVLT